MIDDINKAQRELLNESMKVARLSEKMILARNNFTDAAIDEDVKRMEHHRVELHEVIDQLLDALLFSVKIKKQILNILINSDPDDWPKT